jgi:hypothetical protein
LRIDCGEEWYIFATDLDNLNIDKADPASTHHSRLSDGDPWALTVPERSLTLYMQAAQLYGQALAAGTIPGVIPVRKENLPTRNAIRVVSIVLDDHSVCSLDQLLAAAYCKLTAGDIVLVDVPGRVRGERSIGLDRDILSRKLFAAGFDCPFITAGRDVLAAEASRPSLLDSFLTAKARGAAPKRFPGLDATLEPMSDRLVAFARRGALVRPGDRPWLLSVIMPVYNEEPSFREVIERLLKKEIFGFDIEICVIESNSTDGTRHDVMAFAQHPRVRLLFENKPLGKGHAVRNGLKLATGDIILIQDADLEYDLDDYQRLLDPIRKLEVSFVLGSRRPVGKKTWQIREFSGRPGLSNVLNFAHLLFTLLFNAIFRQRLRDPLTMYKVFRRDCIHNIHFECNRFDFDHELVGKLVRNGFSPVEIDSRYRSRSFDEGKKILPFRDPPTWIKACLKHRFSKLYLWPESR